MMECYLKKHLTDRQRIRYLSLHEYMQTADRFPTPTQLNVLWGIKGCGAVDHMLDAFEGAKLMDRKPNVLREIEGE